MQVDNPKHPKHGIFKNWCKDRQMLIGPYAVDLWNSRQYDCPKSMQSGYFPRLLKSHKAVRHHHVMQPKVKM